MRGCAFAIVGIFCTLVCEAGELTGSRSPIVITGATVIDGTGQRPDNDVVIVVRGDRIVSIGPKRRIEIPTDAKLVDARGKFIVPGLMDGNVHLIFPNLEELVKYEDNYEVLIEEGAQLTLKHGVTTVFDTWGPLQPLMNVRDRIARGEIEGSRMFVAGNVIGFSGPLGRDFGGGGSRLSRRLNDKIAAIWEENVGPELGLLSPEQVRVEMVKYIEHGPDFVKYASSAHTPHHLLAFSLSVQQVIVEEAHKAGLVALAHTTNVESVRMAVEAGADVLIHAHATETEPLVEPYLSMIKDAGVIAGIMPMTRVRMASHYKVRSDELLAVMVKNTRALIQANIETISVTDGSLYSTPSIEKIEDWATTLKGGLQLRARAAVEHGMTPMQALQSISRNVAHAYGVLDDLGTLEKGKIADLIILDADPLIDIGNLNSMSAVMKGGRFISTEMLPVNPIKTIPQID